MKDEKVLVQVDARYIIVKYYTKTCGPCKVVQPVLESFVEQNENFELKYVDCADLPDPKEMGLRVVPTLHLWDYNANKLSALEGSFTRIQLDNWIKSVLPS